MFCFDICQSEILSYDNHHHGINRRLHSFISTKKKWKIFCHCQLYSSSSSSSMRELYLYRWKNTHTHTLNCECLMLNDRLTIQCHQIECRCCCWWWLDFWFHQKKHTQTHKNKNKTKKIRSIKESKYSDYNFVNVRHLASNDKTYDSVYSNTQNESLIGFKLYVFFPMKKKNF